MGSDEPYKSHADQEEEGELREQLELPRLEMRVSFRLRGEFGPLGRPHPKPCSHRLFQVSILKTEKGHKTSSSWGHICSCERWRTGILGEKKRKALGLSKFLTLKKLTCNDLFGPVFPFPLIRSFGNTDSGRVHRSSFSWETKHQAN